MFNLKNVSKMKNLKVMMMTLMMCLMTMFIVSCNHESDAARRERIATEALNKAMLESEQAASKNVIHIKLCVEAANDHTKSEEVRKLFLDELNEIMGTNLELTDDLTAATEDYITALVQKEQYDAIIKKMAEIQQKLLDTETLMEEAESSWWEKLWNATTHFSVQSIAMKNASDMAENYTKSVGDLNAQYKKLEQQLN